MADGTADAGESRRLSGAERREEIVAAAGRALSDQGYLPVAVEQIAREAGVSKALVYAYFPKQANLYNALLQRTLTALEARIDLSDRGGFETRAVAAALAYFDHVADQGAILNVLLTDPQLHDACDVRAIRARDRLWRRFLRASTTYVRLPPEERVAAMAMVLAIPEEMGRLAHRGELTRDRARALCRRLTLSALRGLRTSARASST